MKAGLLLFTLIAITFTAYNAAAHQGDNHEAEYEKLVQGIEKFEASENFKPALLQTSKPNDIIYGDITAPVRIVEYASLSCGACKGFAEVVMPEIKEKFVDTKKAYVVYRHFALNSSALQGAAIVDCVTDPEKKKQLVADLFKVQEKWAFSRTDLDLKGSLKAISKPYLEEEKFNQCYDDESIQDGIIQDMRAVSEGLMVTSTPSIFVNGKRFLGAGKDALIEYIEQQAAKKQ
jgi:protein-disulfide isomerase